MFSEELAATMIVTAISALGGAWGGAQLALDRYRKERAFDRRLDWFESTHDALKNAHDHAVELDVHYSLLKKPPQSAFDGYEKSIKRLSTALSLADLYGSDALRARVTAFGNTYFTEVSTWNSSNDLENSVKIQNQIETSRNLRRALLEHGRSMLPKE